MAPTSRLRDLARRLCASSLVLTLAACGAAPASAPVATGSSPATPGATAVPTPGPSATPVPTLAVQPLPEAAVVRVAVGTGPNVVTFSHDRIWVELHRDDTLASIDPTTFAVTRYDDIRTHCAIAADGGQAVWATIAKDSLVTKVDARTGEAAVTAEVPDACGVAISGDQVWVTSPAGGNIVRLDPDTGAALRTIAVPAMPFMVTVGGDVVYASGEGGGGWLQAFDPETGVLVAERTTPERAMIDQLVPGFGSLWGTARISDSLLRFAPDTLAVESRVRIGREPSGVVATDDAIWVTQLGGTLVRVDPATMTATHAWSLEARWVAWPVLGFGRVWMSALEDDEVLGIDLAALGV